MFFIFYASFFSKKIYTFFSKSYGKKRQWFLLDSKRLDFSKRILILILALPEKVGRGSDKSYRGYLIESDDVNHFSV